MSTYRMGSKIGAGGMAVVHLAVLEGPGAFEKFVVFKRTLGWAANDPQLADRFLNEARLAAQLNHPNIVGTLDVGTDEVSPYIVMEYLRGESVSYMLSTLQDVPYGIPVSLACYVAAQVAAGLDYAHSLVTPEGDPAPIVHRDVSPSNIMVCYNGAVKLLDFGIATRPGEGMTQSGVLKGKVSHMAPEQLQGAPADARSDVFQLAVVLWEMLTRRRLFPGRSNVERMHSVVYREIPPPSSLNDKVPAKLDAVVLRALARDPEKRCPSALDFQEQLETCMMAELPSAGGRELRSWMTATFAERQEFWKGLERQATEGPSVPSEPKPQVEPPRDESHGPFLASVVLSVLLLMAVVGLWVVDGARERTAEALPSASLPRLTVSELPLRRTPLPAPTLPPSPARVEEDRGSVTLEELWALEPLDDAPVEALGDVALPRGEASTEEPPDAAEDVVSEDGLPVDEVAEGEALPDEALPDEALPDEAGEDEDPPDEWRVLEQDEILDPFSTDG